jgi:tetratricopeptide (TPR) repeat protein
VEPPPSEVPPTDSAGSVSRTFDHAAVARLLRVSVRTLRGWERAGILRPGPEGGFTFAAVQQARTLRRLGRRARRVAERLRAFSLAAIEGEQLAVFIDEGTYGARLLVRARGRVFDPFSGQGMLDFSPPAASVRPLPTPPRPTREHEAYQWFLEGCRLDVDEASRASAEHAYRKAIALDPDLASAHTNLGALLLCDERRDEALPCFVRAMELDPTQAEAPYNVGFLLLEDRRVTDAAGMLERAVRLDPGFADAHFNLAVALDQLGLSVRARLHWKRYLALQPNGPFAAIARARINGRTPTPPE